MLACSGCSPEGHNAERKTPEQSISVKNSAQVDIFPVVDMGIEEDFGIVSSGHSAMIGFALIECENKARIDWREGAMSSALMTTLFDVTEIRPRDRKEACHWEFQYHGNGEWVLNLFGGDASKEEGLLVSIRGRTSTEMESK